MKKIDGINEFSSAIAQPDPKVKVEDLAQFLADRPEVESARVLCEGFVSVHFFKAISRWRLQRIMGYVNDEENGCLERLEGKSKYEVSRLEESLLSSQTETVAETVIE